MKVAVVLSFAAAAMANAFDKRACNADNCARQVTGTRPGLTPIESRKADCSSFQLTTVHPEPTCVLFLSNSFKSRSRLTQNSTVTVTVTVDADADGPVKFRRDAPKVAARQATKVPTAIPAYASSCNSGERYASVCSCWGITASVTIASQPTSTVTSTITEDYCEGL